MGFYRLSDIKIHKLADTDNRFDAYISLNFTWIWQTVDFKSTILDYFWLNFMKTIQSWSVKIIGKFITDNRYWKCGR